MKSISPGPARIFCITVATTFSTLLRPTEDGVIGGLMFFVYRLLLDKIFEW